MDGRVQLPVIHFLQERFQVQYVDNITEPGPVKLLAEAADSDTLASVRRRVEISLTRHGSVGLAVVAHHDCTRNPLPRAEQLLQLERAIAFARELWPEVPVIGLWVDAEWRVSEVYSDTRVPECDTSSDLNRTA